MSYLSNTILKYNHRTIDGYDIADYQSLNIQQIKTFLKNLPDSIFKYYTVQDNDKFERISQELYGNPDYWDIIMLINDRNPLTGLPFDTDTIMNLSDNKIKDYEITQLKQSLSTTTKDILGAGFIDDLTKKSDQRTIKYIIPSAMSSFLQMAHDQGVF